MRIINVLLTMLVCVAFGYAKNLPAKALAQHSNKHVTVYQLTDATIDSLNDSLTASASHVYGPIDLYSDGCDLATAVKIIPSATVMTADTGWFSYALSGTPDFTNIGGYTFPGDTIKGTTLVTSTGINLTTNPGRYLFIRLTNKEASVAYLRGYIRVVVRHACN